MLTGSFDTVAIFTGFMLTGYMLTSSEITGYTNTSEQLTNLVYLETTQTFTNEQNLMFLIQSLINYKCTIHIYI